MKVFYELHSNKQYKSGHAVLIWIQRIHRQYIFITQSDEVKEVTTCSFTDKETKFNNAYLPLFNGSVVKNTYKLNKKMIITGPNAAGKTTLLKTTIFNILFTQQTGCGFYDSCKTQPL